MYEKEIGITSNIKSIETLKSGLLSSVAALFKTLAGDGRDNLHDTISDIISSIILICYILAKRLGVNYTAVENRVRSKLRLGLLEADGTGTEQNDLTELSKHFDSSRNKTAVDGVEMYKKIHLFLPERSSFIIG